MARSVLTSIALASAVLIASILGWTFLWNETTAETEIGDIPQTPIADIRADVMAKDAIEYTRENAAEVQGEPVVLLSMASTPDELESFGLGIGQYEDRCDVKAHVVILKGTFDMTGIVVMGLNAPGQKIPAHYVGYIYDAYYYDTQGDIQGGRIRKVTGSLDGSIFKNILKDPALPELEYGPPVTQGEGVLVQPCEPVTLPAADEPPQATTATE